MDICKHFSANYANSFYINRDFKYYYYHRNLIFSPVVGQQRFP